MPLRIALGIGPSTATLLCSFIPLADELNRYHGLENSFSTVVTAVRPVGDQYANNSKADVVKRPKLMFSKRGNQCQV